MKSFTVNLFLESYVMSLKVVLFLMQSKVKKLLWGQITYLSKKGCGRTPTHLVSLSRPCKFAGAPAFCTLNQSKFTAKGQLISKGLFGFYNSSKKRTKTSQPELGIIVLIFFVCFWNNSGYQQVLSKLIDL